MYFCAAHATRAQIAKENGEDVQCFWVDYGRYYPELVDLACFFLSIEVSGAASKRLWSSATFTTTCRPHLSAANLEAMTPLHRWMQRPGFSMKDFGSRIGQLAARKEAEISAPTSTQ